MWSSSHRNVSTAPTPPFVEYTGQMKVHTVLRYSQWWQQFCFVTFVLLWNREHLYVYSWCSWTTAAMLHVLALMPVARNSQTNKHDKKNGPPFMLPSLPYVSERSLRTLSLGQTKAGNQIKGLKSAVPAGIANDVENVVRAATANSNCCVNRRKR